MRYYLFVEQSGLYLRTLGLQDRLAVVHHDGKLLDVSAEAGKRRVTMRRTLQEAKLLLEDKAVYAEYRQEDFREAAEKWLGLLLRYSGTIQPISPSAAFVDLSAHPQAEEVASLLLQDLYKQEQLPIRAGIGPSCWLAELSAVACEPEPLALGVRQIEAIRDARAWLAERPLACLSPLPGEILRRLEQLGVRYVRDLQQMSATALAQQFKKMSPWIRAVAEGRHHVPVRAEWPPQSLSLSLKLASCENALQLDEALRRLATLAAKRVCSNDQVAGGLELYITLESNQVLRTGRPLKHPIQSASAIHTHLRMHLDHLRIEEPVIQVRLLLTDLKKTSRRQIGMPFSEIRDTGALNPVLERIHKAYGGSAVVLGSQVVHSREHLVLKAWREAYGWK